MSISLPQDLAQTIKEMVASGQYGNQSELFRHLLRRWLKSKKTGHTPKKVSHTLNVNMLPLTRRSSQI